MPKYRDNPLIIPFSLLCPGISQNTKHHHLSLYKGQVWREKSYLELCNHNMIDIVYDKSSFYDQSVELMQQNGKLFVPPLPGNGFINDQTRIPYDSEILQSFSELTHITHITFHPYAHEYSEYSVLDYVTYQIDVSPLTCENDKHPVQCVVPYRYIPWYIWTKEGFKIKDNHLKANQATKIMNNLYPFKPTVQLNLLLNLLLNRLDLLVPFLSYFAASLGYLGLLLNQYFEPYPSFHHKDLA